MKPASGWISEKWENVEVRYRVKSLLLEEDTGFQHLQILETHEYGKMLLLDGIVQATEKDEFIYHEMMVHVPMLSHPVPRKVLIIGGGDGGILREVLRYSTVMECTIVEIDPAVVELCKEYLPGLSMGAFDDDRTELFIQDGAAFVRETDKKFDVIIVDSPDPIGPASVLFSKEFYVDLRNLLDARGIMVRQTGSVHMQHREQETAYVLLKELFAFTAFYVYCVPTYIGGLFSTLFCSNEINPLEIGSPLLHEKLSRNPIEPLLYYKPGIHIGAFHIPNMLRGRLP
ncbi:MAG TPA: polyamine aminopropyltransferase [Desulfobacteraceae bacterium]|nr:polyamine aminopropyltransferase [Desulfobacteraceae bacterium]